LYDARRYALATAPASPAWAIRAATHISNPYPSFLHPAASRVCCPEQTRQQQGRRRKSRWMSRIPGPAAWVRPRRRACRHESHLEEIELTIHPQRPTSSQDGGNVCGSVFSCALGRRLASMVLHCPCASAPLASSCTSVHGCESFSGLRRADQKIASYYCRHWLLAPCTFLLRKIDRL
jgi:hypothetical protein